MNVANSLAVPTAAMMPGAMLGQAVSGQPQTLAGLFAMEMGNALQGMPQLPELPFLADGMSEEESGALAELMAVIQQMLAGSSPEALQLEKTASEKLSGESLQVLQGLIAKYAGSLEAEARATGTQTEQQKLVTAFMEQGLTESEAKSFANMLLTLAKTASVQNNSGPQTAMQQAKQLLETLGVEIRKEEKPGAAGKGFFLQQAASRPARQLQGSMPALEQRYAAAAQAVQSLQVNQALSKYQAEAGLVNQSPRVVAFQTGNPAQAGTAVPVEPQQKESPAMPAAFQGLVLDGLAEEQPQLATKAVVNADQFATEMSDLFVKQMKLGNFRGLSQAKITLNPESLGQVDVRLTLQNGVLTAHFTAETKNGKELLDNQMSQLRSALVNQGLQVDRLEVSQPQQQQNAAFAFQQQREQARQQQGGQHQQQKNDGEQAEFSIEKLVEGSDLAASSWNRRRSTRNVEYTV